jgi:hypothetical protein
LRNSKIVWENFYKDLLKSELIKRNYAIKSKGLIVYSFYRINKNFFRNINKNKPEFTFNLLGILEKISRDFERIHK